MSLFAGAPGAGPARDLPLIRSWLFVPGNVPRHLARAYASGADAVVLDLEDAVPLAEKERARGLVAKVLATRAGTRGPLTFVRVNAPGSGHVAADLEAIVRPGLDGIRVPKVDGAGAIVELETHLVRAASRNGIDATGLPIVCGIESARGVADAPAIAASSPRVLALSFGAADLAADLDLVEGADRLETLTVRSLLVLASRAAGIRPPIDSVSVVIDDPIGLERTTRQGRGLGFFGRGAIHPTQVPIINSVFTPSPDELARARAIVEAAEAGAAAGSGSLRLADGTFIDLAIVRRARDVIGLGERLATIDADRG